MSKITLEPNDSGAGTFSIVSPDSNTNRTLNLPDEAGKLLSTGNDDPAEIFKQSNILGTVSESSGVPTGAIIERGSNSNGEFVRYADGTQICWFRLSQFSIDNDNTFTRQGLTVYQNNFTWSFPASFSSSLDIAIQSDFRQNSDQFVSTHNNLRPTETSVELRNFSLSSFSSFARVRIGAIAIGRWF